MNDLDERLDLLVNILDDTALARRQHSRDVIVQHLQRLDDLILRRTLLAKLGHLTADMLIELAEIVGEALGWSPDMKKLEIIRTIEILKVKHGVGFIKV